MQVKYNTRPLSTVGNYFSFLEDKPYINNVEIQGDVTSRELNTYTIKQVDHLIATTRIVYKVNTLPAAPVARALYYIGPDSAGDYHLYLYDSDLNPIYLGTSEISKLEVSKGLIERPVSSGILNLQYSEDFLIDSESNKIKFNKASKIDENSTSTQLVDASTIYSNVYSGFDSEGKSNRGFVPMARTSDKGLYLAADGTWKGTFKGATATTDGAPGLAPFSSNDGTCLLFGDGTWRSVADLLYPVGTVYQSTSSTSPKVLFGGNWTKIEGRSLYCAGGAYTTVKGTGGSASVTLEVKHLPSHKHTIYDKTLTTGKGSDGHTHPIISRASEKVSQIDPEIYVVKPAHTKQEYTSSSGAHQHNIPSFTMSMVSEGCNSWAHNNMPPFLVVYMWYRES